MQLTTSTLLVLSFVGLVISLAILYYIIKQAVKDAVTQTNKELVKQLAEVSNPFAKNEIKQ